MGNFSANPDLELRTALDRDYCRVRFQQGKPALDRELNLAADLASPQRLAAQYVGSGVAGTGTDFAISNLNVAGNDFTIGAGRCLVNGLEAVLRADTTYTTQPNRRNVGPLPAGTSNVYLRVFEREVTGAEDASLTNPGDVTFETAVRNKIEWEVRVSAAAIARPDHLLLAVITTAPAGIVDRRRLNLSVAAVHDELVAARGAAADLPARLNTALTPTGALAANTVASAQLKLAVRFSGRVSLPANGQELVRAFTGDRHGRLFVSVFIPGSLGVDGRVSWSEVAISQAPLRITRGIRVQNENGAPVTVEVEIVELLAT